jgi:redox-sensing transcriptional repressor
MENIEGFVKDNNIDIAVLTIPKDGAVKAAEVLVKCKIKAIWNFAHVDLKVPDDVVVENVHLSDSLMKLSYGIAN